MITYLSIHKQDTKACSYWSSLLDLNLCGTRRDINKTLITQSTLWSHVRNIYNNSFIRTASGARFKYPTVRDKWSTLKLDTWRLLLKLLLLKLLLHCYLVKNFWGSVYLILLCWCGFSIFFGEGKTDQHFGRLRIRLTLSQWAVTAVCSSSFIGKDWRMLDKRRYRTLKSSTAKQ